VDDADVTNFLERIGVAELGPPSLAALNRLHASFAERVPYETLDIQLNRDTTLDPADSAHRIVQRRRGGYCFHLNGAFSYLLRALGYQVTRHRAGVQVEGKAAEISRNHLALTVTGLPDDRETAWLVDLGLGDGLHTPVPLRAGIYHQEPFSYRLRPSEIAPGGWRLDHDAHGSFLGMDFDPAPATMTAFADMHKYLSTSPESTFVQNCVVMRRDATSVETLRARTFSRRTGKSHSVTFVESRVDWFAVLADVFGLTLNELSAAEREHLWRRVTAQHEAYLARQ
jgi:N-hydroxyarylamine O-acetyltransferase